MFGIKCLEADVSMSFDIHGDEALRLHLYRWLCLIIWVIVTNKSFGEKFEELYPLINPDYQTKYGYEKVTSMLKHQQFATSWIGNQI